MLTIEITPEEVASRQMTSEHIAEAVAAIRTDGLVVLKDVIDLAHVDILKAKMLEDVEALLARKDIPFNWNANNIQQNPPPFPPYLFRDVLLNDMAVAVTKAVLGPGVKNVFYSGNTAMPGKDRQPVHADTGQLWPDLPIAHPATQLVVNIPVVDMSAENGSTEIWPGTHLDTTISIQTDIKIPHEVIEARRTVSPPLQPEVKRGSILIRDIRLWHAGMPNYTQDPRPMIALIHVIGWLETGEGLTFPKGTEEFFADSELRTVAKFVDESIDHILAPGGYEYEQPEDK